MTDRHNSYANDFHLSPNYQAPGLPKVRPSSNSTSSTGSNEQPTRRLPVPAVPATPRMLKNSSGHFPFQPSAGQFQFGGSQTPQRATHLAPEIPSRQVDPTTPSQYYQSPNTRNPWSPAKQVLAPIDTSPLVNNVQPSEKLSPIPVPSKLLSPASLSQNQTHHNHNHQNYQHHTQQNHQAHQTNQTHHQNHSQNHQHQNQKEQMVSISRQKTPENPKKQQSTQFHRRSIGDWDFMKTIGAGSMGKVKLAKHRRTGETCAIKIVPRAARLYGRAHANDPPPLDVNEAMARRKEFEKELARDRRTIREAALGKILYHPFICRLFEVIKMSNHFYMLFEYVSGGQMLDYIVSHGSLKERNARKFARGIGSALDYLHKNNVVHRDLKIENIMISKSGEIKIIDFGLSNLYANDRKLKTYCGSLYFAAPELLSAHPYTGPEVDVWSFGVVLYVLVCGKVPFDDESVSVLHEKIKKGKVEYPENLTHEVVSLLQRMLVVNPSKRADLSEVLRHPWMVKGYDAPAASSVLHRIPLALPLDHVVIKEMIELEFGSNEQQISDELALIITSEEYIEASKQLIKARDPSALKVSPTCAFHPLVSIYYLVEEMLARRRARDSIVDIPASISENSYNRQSSTEAQPVSDINTNSSGGDVTPTAPPVLAFPEAVHTSPIHGEVSQQLPVSQIQSSNANSGLDDFVPQQQKQTEDKGLNSILRKFSQRRSASVKRPPTESTQQQTQQELKHHISNIDNLKTYQDQSNEEDKLVRRVGSMKIVRQPTYEYEKIPPPNTTKKTHSRTVSAYSTMKAGSALEPAPLPTRKYHPTARAKSVGHRRDHVHLALGEIAQVPPLPADLNDYAYFDDVTLDEYLPDSQVDKVTSVNSNTSSNTNNTNNTNHHNNNNNSNNNKKERSPYDELTEDQIVKEAENAPEGSMPSIEYPKTMFLKGLFSVQTTSTKPLPVVRSNVISTLTRLGVKFNEVRGGFICTHTPSIEQAILITPDVSQFDARTIDKSDRTGRTGSIKSNKSMGDAASTETEKTLEKKGGNGDDRSSCGDNSSDQQVSLNSKTTHRRKFSLGGSILSYRRKQSGALPSIPNTPIAANMNNLLASPNARNYTGVEFDSSASLDSIGGMQGGSDMLVSSRIEQNKMQQASLAIVDDDSQPMSAFPDDYKPASAKVTSVSSRTPLKFEIHIVKVPLVGLFGVHLKKVTGNTWNYKELAAKILKELNL